MFLCVCVCVCRNLSEELKKEEQRLVDAMETELASVKGQLQGAERLCDAQTLDSNQLTAEFDDTEDAIRRIKEDMEHLTQEIKEANLQSLSIAPADDLKVLLEGINPPPPLLLCLLLCYLLFFLVFFLFFLFFFFWF